MGENLGFSQNRQRAAALLPLKQLQGLQSRNDEMRGHARPVRRSLALFPCFALSLSIPLLNFLVSDEKDTEKQPLLLKNLVEAFRC